MDKLKMHSINKVDENVEKIARLFPNCVTESLVDGKLTRVVDFDMLKQELSDFVVEGREERYQFTWPDKKKSVLLANAPINKTLRPCREESVNFDTTENLYIEGDNLEVLKLLQETYLGKVKMIYIDPPYNTGNDFVYEDDFAQNAEDYISNSGQYDEEGNRLVQNTERNGRFHTDWLNMIYPRLKLAKDLLTDDGVIFISIDDNEVAQLRKICDEVFGEGNCFAEFPRVTKKGGKSSDVIAKNHDYILLYAKSAVQSDLIGVSHTDSGYSNKDEHFEERGYYKANQTLDYDSLGYVKTLDYPIEIDGEVFYAGGDIEMYNDRQRGQHGRADWGWRWSKELFDFGFANDFIEIHRGGARPRIYTKTYQNVSIEKIGGEYQIVNIDRTKPLSTLEFTENKYSNDNAKKVFDTIMQKGVFEYTKPPELIAQLARLVNGNDFTVLDFFSGSATTAHAVMQLNAEDGGNRKFIMVQIPEQTAEKSEAYKAGYKTICEIGKERIRRAGDKLKETLEKDGGDFRHIAQNIPSAPRRTFTSDDGQQSFTVPIIPARWSAADESDTNKKMADDLDIGFRVLKCDSGNMKDVYYSPSEYEQSLFSSLTDNIKEDRSPEDLLFQVMLDLGVLLSSKIEETTIAGKKVFSVADGYLIACFDENLTDETIKAIAQKKPYYFVMRDGGYASDSVATNFDQIFAAYSPSTIRKVL